MHALDYGGVTNFNSSSVQKHRGSSKHAEHKTLATTCARHCHLRVYRGIYWPFGFANSSVCRDRTGSGAVHSWIVIGTDVFAKPSARIDVYSTNGHEGSLIALYIDT